jgi:predicted Zn-dependent protease
MRRTLHLKRFLALVLVVGVLGAGGHFLHGYQLQRNAQAYLAQAVREQESNNPSRALAYLQTYLGFRPSDNAARERFALLLADSSPKLADLERVFFDLERVLRDAPDRPDLRRKAAEVALRIGRPTDAIVHLKALAELPGADAGVFELLGDAQEKNRKLLEAADGYREAIRRDPRRVSSYAALARLQQTRLDNPRQADEVMASMIAQTGDTPEAVLAQGRYQLDFKGESQQKEARQKVRKLIDGGTEDPEVLLLAADLELARADRKDLDAARAFLQRGLKARPEDFRFLQGLARLALAEGKPDEAARLLRGRLAQLPDLPETLATAADLFLDASGKEEARGLMQRIPRDELTAGILDYLAARIHMADEEWPAALEKLKRSEEGSVRMPELLKQVHLLAGECYRRLGNPDQHLASAAAALRIDLTWLPAQLSRAEAAQELGRTEEAARLFSSLADRLPGTRLSAARLWLGLARSGARAQQPLQEAAALLEGVPDGLQKKADYRLLHIQLLAAEGNLAGALREAEAATKDLPADPSLWVARADLLTMTKRLADVPALLDEAEKTAGGALVRLARVLHLQNSGKQQEARDLLARYQRGEGELSPEERKVWLRGLTGVYLSLGDAEGAEGSLRRLAALEPRDVRVRGLLLEILLTKFNAEKLAALAGELQPLEGDDGVYWRLAEAARLFAARDQVGPEGLGRARALLVEVTKRRPGWAAPLVLEGMLHQQEGDNAGAIDRYKRAVDLGERRPRVVRRLVRLYLQSRHYVEAQDLLRRLQQASGTAGLGRLAAEVSLSAREDPTRSLELARQAVSEKSTDFQDHLWLGQVLTVLGKPKEAEKALRRAVELAEKRPEPWVALVQFLSAQGRRDEARQETARAVAKLPPDTDPVALATCWEAVGDRAAAAALYKKALASRPDDPGLHQAASQFHLRGGETDQAVAHLRKILELRGTAPPLAAWARRSLALTLAGGRNYQRSTEALGLLKEHATGKQFSAEDRRVMALIQATRPGDRKEAIRNLEAAFLQVPPTDEERFLLACLHMASRDQTRAREEFVRLLTASASPNPGYLAVFVQLLIQQGELGAAAHWLDELEKLQPKELRTAALKARLLHARKEDEQAVAFLREFAAAATDPARQLMAGRMLDEIGSPAEAERYLRAFAQERGKEDPSSLIPLIEHLGRRGRLKEALNLCEQLRGKVPEETMVPVWFRCLRSGPRDDAQCRRVEAWVEADMRKQPDKALFALALANLRDLEGKVQEAEKAYRSVLRHDPGNLIALNNLAALLAFRGEQGAEALAYIEKAIELAGPLPGLLDTRAIVYLSQGQGQRAARDLEEVVGVEPSPTSYLRLARAYSLVGDSREARVAIRKVQDPRGKVADFHPLERPAYEQLLRDLGDG